MTFMLLNRHHDRWFRGREGGDAKVSHRIHSYLMNGSGRGRGRAGPLSVPPVATPLLIDMCVLV